MKILFIGGSNLIVLHGISEKIPYFLQMAGVVAEPVVSNLAVGGTGSLFGWERLCRHDGEQYDAVVLEYGINDLFVRKNDRELWREGFKGLLRSVRRRFPEAVVANVLLGRRSESHWQEQAALHREMKDISAMLGVHTIDVDGHFKRSEFGEVFSSLYKDDNHYLAPVAVGYVAQYCALGLADLIQRHAWTQATPVPSATGEVVMHVTPFPREQRDFIGSRFSWKASWMALDDQTVVDVPGVPVGLSFVSAPESCAIHVSVLGGVSIVNTATAWTQRGLFPFLVTHTPVHGFWNKDMPIPASSRLTISAINAGSALWDGSLVQGHGYPEGRPDPEFRPKSKVSGVYLDAITSWTRMPHQMNVTG